MCGFCVLAPGRAARRPHLVHCAVPSAVSEQVSSPKGERTVCTLSSHACFSASRGLLMPDGSECRTCLYWLSWDKHGNRSQLKLLLITDGSADDIGAERRCQEGSTIVGSGAEAEQAGTNRRGRTRGGPSSADSGRGRVEIVRVERPVPRHTALGMDACLAEQVLAHAEPVRCRHAAPPTRPTTW